MFLKSLELKCSDFGRPFERDSNPMSSIIIRLKGEDFLINPLGVEQCDSLYFSPFLNGLGFSVRRTLTYDAFR